MPKRRRHSTHHNTSSNLRWISDCKVWVAMETMNACHLLKEELKEELALELELELALALVLVLELALELLPCRHDPCWVR